MTINGFLSHEKLPLPCTATIRKWWKQWLSQLFPCEIFPGWEMKNLTLQSIPESLVGVHNIHQHIVLYFTILYSNLKCLSDEKWISLLCKWVSIFELHSHQLIWSLKLLGRLCKVYVVTRLFLTEMNGSNTFFQHLKIIWWEHWYIYVMSWNNWESWDVSWLLELFKVLQPPDKPPICASKGLARMGNDWELKAAHKIISLMSLRPRLTCSEAEQVKRPSPIQ